MNFGYELSPKARILIEQPACCNLLALSAKKCNTLEEDPAENVRKSLSF